MKNIVIASIGIVASNETLIFDQPDENSFDNFVTVAPFRFETAEPWGTAVAALNRDLDNNASEDIYQLCPSLPAYEDWKCKLNACRYKCKGGKTEKATCIFTNGKYKWTGSANPFCLVEENLPQEESINQQCHVHVRPLLNLVQKFSDKVIIGCATVNVVS